MSGRRALAAVCAPAALTLLPAAVLAVEGGAHHAEHHAPGLDTLLFPVINFALFAFIIARYVVPAIRQYLQQRREQIVAAAGSATTALAEAERRVSAASDRLAHVEVEGAAIREDLITTARQQSERLREIAEETGARRLTDAGLLAEQERWRALGDVRAEVAALATRLAEERIRGALGPDDQRAFVAQFLRDAVAR